MRVAMWQEVEFVSDFFCGKTTDYSGFTNFHEAKIIRVNLCNPGNLWFHIARQS
jgi:hypothetical protein